MPRAKEDYAVALARMYSAYVERPLKATEEYTTTGAVTPATLEAVIEASPMGIQNEVIKEKLKEFTIENQRSLLVIETLDREKEILIKSRRRRLALKAGRVKAKLRRHEEGVTRRDWQVARAKRDNFVRLYPYLARFTVKQLAKLENLDYVIGSPRVRRDGTLTVRYKGKTLTQKQLLRRTR